MAFPGRGDDHAAGPWLDTVESTISLGVREMACRLNGDGKNFDKAAANLARTAQVALSGETLRSLVEAEGQRVLRGAAIGTTAARLVGGGLQIEEKTPRGSTSAATG